MPDVTNLKAIRVIRFGRVQCFDVHVDNRSSLGLTESL